MPFILPMNKPLPALIALLLGIQVSALFAAGKKPNIVFVLVDDQRNTSLGCAGHPQIKTPVIDSLGVKNLIADSAHADTLARLRKELAEWRQATDDRDVHPKTVPRRAQK